jgi:23S rRNA pseudouridine1911/1915/1917 synthase
MSPPVPPPHHELSPGSVLASSLVARCLGGDEAAARALMAFGGVYLNKKRLREDCMTAAGDYLRIHPRPRRFPATGIEWEKRVLRLTPEYIVVDKPAGIPVHATCDNLVENCSSRLAEYLGVELKTTQRLDIGTQGLLVFARTAEFQTRFNRWLHDRKVKKRYRALIATAVPEGDLVHYMAPGDRAPRIVGTEAQEGWKLCALTVERVTAAGDFFQAEIKLHTGRTHQIRAQLGAIGAPVVGDTLYGSAIPAPAFLGPHEAIALQSFELSFPGEEGLRLPAPW